MTLFDRLVFLTIVSTPFLYSISDAFRIQGLSEGQETLTAATVGFLFEIRPVPCLGSEGHSGTCMFVQDCDRVKGTRIGLCIDRFLFGTCCELRENSTESPVEERSTQATTLAQNVNEVFNEAEIKNETYNDGEYSIVQVPSRIFAECGTRSNAPSMRVVGGKDAKPNAWPWQVSVRLAAFYGTESTHRCGGVLLNENYVLTAAHCIYNIPTAQIRVRFGEHDLYGDSETHPHIERAVNEGIQHPHYTVGTYENDLALLKLDHYVQEAVNIRPICLPDEDMDESRLIGREATITGWGRLNDGGKLPPVLQQVDVPIIDNKKCREMFKTAGKKEPVPDMFVCAGYEKGGKDSCQGDSGGPLQLRNDDGRWFLVGIISWGISCAQPNLPGVSTRISKFKNWIFETINSEINV